MKNAYIVLALGVFLVCFITGTDSTPEGYRYGYESANYLKYPADCKSGYCEYEAKWSYDYKSDFVTFTITAKVERGYWAGIGFSEKKDSYHSDLITGYVKKYKYHFLLDDRHVEYKDPYKAPVDPQQDAVLISHSYQNGKLVYTFKRKRYTGDKYDKSLKKCVYFKFTWGGMLSPAYLPYKGKNVIYSKKKICVGPISYPAPYADPCKKKHCKANSYCVHDDGYAKCKCRSGYYMKSEYCHKHVSPAPYADPCKKKHCKANSYCVRDGGYAKCKCKSGYYMKSEYCHKHVASAPYADPCKKKHCKANSYCVRDGGYAKCKCKSGYYMKSEYCHKYVAHAPYVDPCKKTYCKTNEYCKIYDGYAKCECKPGYRGKYNKCMDAPYYTPGTPKSYVV